MVHPMETRKSPRPAVFWLQTAASDFDKMVFAFVFVGSVSVSGYRPQRGRCRLTLYEFLFLSASVSCSLFLDVLMSVCLYVCMSVCLCVSRVFSVCLDVCVS